jgi:3-isopropylmalate dehydrogenase
MGQIAVIAGDGIGIEVTREAVKVMRAANRAFKLGLDIQELDYGAERYLRDGTTLPKGEIERMRREVDAVFVGALGDPRIPDMRHGREILLAMRFELDLYINLRPAHCLSDAFCPLKNKTARDVRFVVMRENTEGLYAGVGGNFKKGTPDEIAINEDINTRKGVERIIRAAFEYAQANGCKRVTMADKANAVRFAHDLWQRTFREVGAGFPGVESEHYYVDALVMEMVRHPERFEVIVTNNLFGDILSDLGAQLQGGLGIAPSANLGAGKTALFEPVHGSAPKYAGKDIANPLAAILSAKMLLEHLGHKAAAQAVGKAVAHAVATNNVTADVGGKLGTRAAGDFVAQQLA